MIDAMSELGMSLSTRGDHFTNPFPRVTTDFGRCGPPFPHSPGPSGPRCDRCKARSEETGEDTYCGTLVPLAHTIW